ncbi:MAG: T9SS type A sorting domain-containing protein, partial [Phaeodactylibacter sp.]|nr:T9SS type A sorting domain-containing protein [Phaeodactylibacter sp.]
TGNREDMEEACIEFAKRGFVAVTIDYRLYNIFLGVPDSLTVSQVVVQAIGDMKAAIRALRQDAATVNEFRVDTSRIIAGGVSAGGILANHCAYLDPDDPIPTFFMDVLEDNGGIEGNSGDADNLSYPSNVMMSISLSGAIYDDLWMEAGDPPLATIHGTEDEIVPYMHGFASAPIGPSTVPLMSMDGSGRLHERADALGIPNFHVAVPNGGHEDIYFDIQYESYRNEFNWEGAIFMYEQLCPSIDILPNSTEDRTPQLELDVFPNPVNAYLLVQPPIINQPYRLSIFDSFGKAVYTASGLVGEVEWQRGALPAGMYYLQVMYEHRELPLLRRKVVLR